MLIKIILVLIVLGLVYKLFGGKIPKFKENKSDAQTLVECDRCGTFVTQKEALSYRGKHFCSQSCKTQIKE